MKAVDDLRREIDAADAAIVAALNARFALTRRMRELKRREGLAPIDADRERAVIERALAATDPAERDTVASVYETLLRGSRGFVETIARGVAIQDGKVLLCRAKGGATTYLPGGHIEFGETGAAALEREVREELGVGAKAGRLLGVVENAFLQHGKRHAEINLVYALEVPEGTAAQSCEEWIEFEWRPLAEVGTANLLPAEMIPLVRAAEPPTSLGE